MDRDHPTVTLGDDDPALAALLADRIYAFNVAATGLADGRMLTIRIEDDGEVIAALSGWTWGGCGYVDILWVDERRRRQGLGTALMDAAEAEAVARGCTGMALSSHSFQAPGLYLARGYVETGRTPDYPTGFAQIHFRKALPPPRQQVGDPARHA